MRERQHVVGKKLISQETKLIYGRNKKHQDVKYSSES